MGDTANTAAASSGMRTGAQFLSDLSQRERTIFVEGDRFQNPTSHPAFAGAARTLAGLFDFAAAPEIAT